jgi:protein SCO1
MPQRGLRLEDERGRAVSLPAYRGRVVVLAPFLTLCHEVCPLTTGAFEEMKAAVDRAGLGGRVVFVEVSVDPWRDDPARLRAFARLTSVRFPLLTGSRRQLARFWRFFDVGYWHVPEGRPPERDWLTGTPLTFDVGHTDGLVLLDTQGRERIVVAGIPRGGLLSPALRRLLDAQGRQELQRQQPGWTTAQALSDVAYLLGRPLPERD